MSQNVCLLVPVFITVGGVGLHVRLHFLQILQQLLLLCFDRIQKSLERQVF